MASGCALSLRIQLRRFVSMQYEASECRFLPGQADEIISNSDSRRWRQVGQFNMLA